MSRAGLSSANFDDLYEVESEASGLGIAYFSEKLNRSGCNYSTHDRILCYSEGLDSLRPLLKAWAIYLAF